MLQDYAPVLLHVIVAIGFATVAMLANIILGRAGKRNAAKDTVYECGMVPETAGQPRFSVKFYLVAMLFILFDIEVVFLIPWAFIYRDFLANNISIMGPIAFFFGVLVLGLFYEVKKGALDWEK
jgi:NADH-quinone oxidoreductase subunit A